MLLPFLLSLAGLVLPGLMCFYGTRRYKKERDAKVRELEQQAARAAAAAEGGTPLPLPGLAAAGVGAVADAADAALQAALQRDSLTAPLLRSIPEDSSDDEGSAAGAAATAAAAVEAAATEVQSLEELPGCVQQFLGRSIRDGRTFRLFTLVQLGQMKLDPKGGWKEATATQRACPLEPAFVWTACARLAPLVTVRGCDSLVNNTGYCSWQLWGAVPAGSGGGRQIEQSLRVRWLSEAVCFPQALMPSRFLRWEAVRGEDHEAEAVLTYGGTCVRATFTFDRFGRVSRMRSRDFLRRLPGGAFEQGEWQVDYSGHMLFGLSTKGDVMSEECATHSGVFIPTNVQASWTMPDGSRWTYAKFTVGKVSATV